MNAGQSEDEALAAAIKLSFEESQKNSKPVSDAPRSQPSKDPIVDLTNDSDNEDEIKVVFPKSNSVVGSDTDAEASDDDDLKRAIALSLANRSSPQANKSPKDSSQQQSQNAGTQPQPPPANRQASTGILGLDRKQMEQERLMRLNKRKAESIASEPEPPQKAARISASPGFEITGSQKSPARGSFARNQKGTSPSYQVTQVKYFSSTPDLTTASNVGPATNRQPSVQSVASVQSVTRPGQGMQWPSGIVKKTRLANSPRKHDDISIEEVLQRDDLELAVMSSYLWDMEWVLGKLDTQRTRILFVVHAQNEERAAYEMEASVIPNLRFCFPSLEGQINIMHSKLMLLFHKDYLRIVVPSANLISVDWGDHNLMENTVFLIDLPLKKPADAENSSTKSTADTDTYTQFYNDLVIFLKASSYPQGIIEKLAKFDFSKTAKYAFVHTIGGSHSDEIWRWTGYTGLGRAVSNLGLQSQSPISVDFITSSLGALNEDLLRGIYLACKGDDGTTDYQFRNTKQSAKATSPLKDICQEWRDRIRVYFPSFQTVNAVANAARRRPEDIGGTVCFGSKYWNGPKMPKHALRDCQSQRNVLMHNKIAFVRPSKPIPLPDGDECRGWAYVGSANLSESAWGRLVKDRATGEPKLNCRNWECGVLVPVTSETTSSTPSSSSEDLKGDLAVDLFNDTIPVPMKVPSERLGPGREPWFFMG